jgi:hypothetical protein
LNGKKPLEYATGMKEGKKDELVFKFSLQFDRGGKKKKQVFFKEYEMVLMFISLH